ncbi:uncharacterized protein [Ptychodera flava]|uniref:uncharacterized protein n=1 Tax=Ptychodera flava TaxID=63121 RepID=UPI00396A4C7D
MGYVIVVAFLLINAVHSMPAHSQYLEDNTYVIAFHGNGVTANETIYIDEDKNVEIYQGIDSGTEIVKDFDAGIEAIVRASDDQCYVKPLINNENTPPSELKSKIENVKLQGDDLKAEERKEQYYALTGNAIKNLSVIGETIAERCTGRDVYWLTPFPLLEKGRDRRNTEDCDVTVVVVIGKQSRSADEGLTVCIIIIDQREM